MYYVKQVNNSRLPAPYESKCVDSWYDTDYKNWVENATRKYSLVVSISDFVAYQLGIQEI